MKQLLITIAAVVLVGCGEKDYSGYYWAEVHKHNRDPLALPLNMEAIGISDKKGIAIFNLKKNKTAILIDTDRPDYNEECTWDVNNESLLIYKEGLYEEGVPYLTFNKFTLKLESRGNEGVAEGSKLHFYLNKGVYKGEPFITQCRACNDKVSSVAKVCPHCGQPDPV